MEDEMDIWTVHTGAQIAYEGSDLQCALNTWVALQAGGYHARLEKNGVLVQENSYITEKA